MILIRHLRGALVLSLLALASGFVACAQPLPTTPDEAAFVAPGGGSITVEYVCGNIFRFQNRSSDTLTVHYRVHGVQESGDLFLAARPEGAEYGEFYLTTKERGPLQVYRGDDLVVTVPNKHLPECSVVPDTIPSIAPDSLPVWVRADSSVDSDGFTKGVIVVVFEEGTTQAQRSALVASMKATVIGGLGSPLDLEGFYYLRLNDPAALANPDSVVRAFESSPLLESVAREYRRISPSWTRPFDGIGWEARDWVTDPANASGENWGLEAMRLPLAWGCEKGSSAARLGIVDYQFDATEFGSNTVDDHGAFGRTVNPGPHHGTMMGNFIAARGGDSVGMTGTSQRASLFLRDLGYNGLTAPELTQAVEQMIQDKVKVVNISFSATVPYVIGGQNVYPRRSDPRAIALVARILAPTVKRFKKLRSQGKLPLLVFAAGNDVYDAYFALFPALRDEFPDNVVTVGAADRSLTGTWTGVSTPHGPLGSNYGDHVDLYAPGEDVYTHKDGTLVTASSSGTSDAAALVTGLLGLALAHDSTLTPKELRDLLLAGANERGVLIPHGHATAGSAPVPDAYNLVRAVSRRPKTPLCGNRIWANEGTVWAEREGHPDEQLFSLNVGPAGWIFPYHGGRVIAAQDMSDGRFYRFERAPAGNWAATGIAHSVFDSVTGGGMSTFGYTHDRDTTVWVSGGSLHVGPRYGTTTATIGLPAYSGTWNSGGEGCTKWVRTSPDESYHCEVGWSVEIGSGTEARWVQEAAPAGSTGALVAVNFMSTRYWIDEQRYSCFDIRNPPLDSDNCWRQFPTGTAISDSADVFRVNWSGGTPDKLTKVEGKTIVSLASSEDGSGFAAFMQSLQSLAAPANCGTQFYKIDSPTQATATGGFHLYGSTCDTFGEQGSFGPTREWQATALGGAPTSRGFNLMGRAAAVIGGR